jgi:hypothetical protein
MLARIEAWTQVSWTTRSKSHRRRLFEPCWGIHLCSADALDDRNQLLAWVALLTREADEFAGVCDDGAALWGSAYTHAEPATELQETFVAQSAQRTQDSVGVYRHDRCEIASRWQALSGLSLAVGDRTTDLCGYLVMQRRGI